MEVVGGEAVEGNCRNVIFSGDGTTQNGKKAFCLVAAAILVTAQAGAPTAKDERKGERGGSGKGRLGFCTQQEQQRSSAPATGSTRSTR